MKPETQKISRLFPAVINLKVKIRGSMAKIVLDLHDIYNKGFTIDAELNRCIEEAIEKRIALVEIIPGKGSGQLKKRVLRFLSQPQIKRLYHRLEKDDKNFGRIFLHFRY
jgi:hypothetical protein